MMKIDDRRPVLSGRFVRMEPIGQEHAEPLWEAIAPGDITRWFPQPISRLEDLQAYISEAERFREAGTAVPFVTLDAQSGRPIGASRFGNINCANHVVEIGWTFISAARQRSGCNREAKLLQLSHAFDVWGCNRVEFKTDSLNEKSRNALKGIGAVEEGIFRNHVVCHDGRLRHSAWYSVIREEWPDVRSRLKSGLNP